MVLKVPQSLRFQLTRRFTEVKVSNKNTIYLNIEQEPIKEVFNSTDVITNISVRKRLLEVHIQDG